jgi:hypothetical protein
VTDEEGRFGFDSLPVGWEFRPTVWSPSLGTGEGESHGRREEAITIAFAAAENACAWVRPVMPPGSSIDDLWLPREPSGRREEGRICFYLEAPESVRLYAWFGEVFHRAAVDLAPGVEREVEFEPADPENAWLVRVLDPEGRPLPGGRARFHGPWGRGEPLRGGVERGRVTYCSFTNGEAPEKPVRSVDLYAFRDERGRPLPYAPVRAGPFPPGISTFRLRPGRIVVAEVVSTGGRPIRGAWVMTFRVSEDSEESGRLHAEALTGIDGRCRLVGLGRGEYEVSVQTPHAFVDPAPVRIGGGADRVTVTAVPKVVARVRVLDPTGRPVAGARVTLDAAGEWEPFEGGRLVRTTGQVGEAVFPLLPPDLPVALRVAPPARGLLPHADWDWTPRDTTVRLAPAQSLAGKVLDADGRTVPDATVFLRAAEGAPPLPEGFSWTRIEGGYVLGAITGTGGRFEIPGLPETRLRVFAVVVREDGTETRSPIVSTPSGASGLLLRLP